MLVFTHDHSQLPYTKATLDKNKAFHVLVHELVTITVHVESAYQGDSLEIVFTQVFCFLELSDCFTHDLTHRTS